MAIQTCAMETCTRKILIHIELEVAWSLYNFESNIPLNKLVRVKPDFNANWSESNLISMQKSKVCYA